MSNRRHTTAILRGYDGPFFSDLADSLGKELGKIGVTSKEVSFIASGISSYLAEPWFNFVTTSDNYIWSRKLKFVVDDSRKSEVVVLIPWFFDYKLEDGTRSERAIAVYTKNASLQAAEEIVRKLMENVFSTVSAVEVKSG